jgi:hypothetical protein
LNLELEIIGNHGHIELKDLCHEKVKILDGFKKQSWKVNKLEMRVSIVLDVVPIFITLVPSLLHQKNIGVTYVGTLNNGINKIRAIILCGNVLVYDYNY